MEKDVTEEKKNYYYAQTNNENICVSISQLSGEVIQENMIELENYDNSVMGKRYENRKWQELPESEPVILLEPTNSELLQTINDLRAELEIAGVIL